MSVEKTIGVAVVGCGLIGGRRAETAAAHDATRLVAVADPDRQRARELAERFGADVVDGWEDAARRDDVDVVAVCTPNGFLAEIAVGALRSGKHVLLEKPMGRNVQEARAIAAAAREGGRLLKVGFNHRYHPAIRRARELVAAGEIGRIVNIRGRYGHGARPGYEKEWRGDPELAGGGHLTDQGVHLLDLMHWFTGEVPDEAVGFTQTAVWPMEPLEDNAFGLLRYADGAVAQLHVSMTQWKNLFSFEVFGERGSVAVEGLGGSYGTERLVHARRRPEGGAPEMHEEAFPGPDESWAREWDDFIHALRTGGSYLGGPDDGLAVMRTVDALYRSARAGRIVEV